MRIVNLTPGTTHIVFLRPNVIFPDFRAFLSVYAPDALAERDRLADAMNSLSFGIDGYEMDSRELYSIPEVRKFYAALLEQWPYWLYFCDLRGDGLRMMTLCVMDSVSPVPSGGRPGEAGVYYEPAELLRWLAKHFLHMNVCCDLADLGEKAVKRRTDAIFRYYDLPVTTE